MFVLFNKSNNLFGDILVIKKSERCVIVKNVFPSSSLSNTRLSLKFYLSILKVNSRNK